MDIKEIINSILSASGASVFSEKLYTDEPIIRTASDLMNQSPSRIRAMRKLARGYINTSDEKTFIEQAKYMADYEDCYEYRGSFLRYYPTYQCMDDSQLRGYFSWRTELRKGVVRQTSLSFAFVYVYELLNLIGVETAQEGFEKLRSFWAEYRRFDSKLDYYLKIWLTDFIIFYGLDTALISEFYDTEPDSTVLLLMNSENHTPSEIFHALNSFSSYNMEKSKFYLSNPEAVEAVVYNSFIKLSEYYKQNRKNSLCEKFFGNILIDDYRIFNAAVFYGRDRVKNTAVEINEINRYSCTNGKWKHEHFIAYKGKNREIGELLRAIDYLIRQAYNYKSTLKADKILKLYRDIITEQINRQIDNEKKKSIKEIKIDLSALGDIRKAASSTREKLLTEEELFQAEEEPEAVIAATENESAHGEVGGLDAVEREFLRLLLENGDYQAFSNGNGKPISVLADSVNEKLFELFSDTVLDFDGDSVVMIEDYIEDIKGLLLK